MKVKHEAGFLRFMTVIKLFVNIFWAFYSLKYKALWRREGWKERRKAELYIEKAALFREKAIDLGGLLIKLGQFFSTRVDILPRACIDELANLQDKVREVEYPVLKAFAEAQYQKPLAEIFAEVEEKPVAAASLGQVHKVVLQDGSRAVLKIQRPGIDQLIETDLKALKKITQFIKKFSNWGQFIDFDKIYLEFAATVKAELDYVQEGKNAEIIKQNSGADPDLIIPQIYWDYTADKVLVMEYVDGIKINEPDALIASGVDPVFISHRLLQIYIKQILIDGFFHADPHPGNLFVGRHSEIVMVDFGMVGTILPDTRDILTDMVFALINRDFHKAVQDLKKVGFISKEGDDDIIARTLGMFLERILGSHADFTQSDLKFLFKNMEKLLYEQPFQIPANFTFLGKALGTVYGICIKLNPDINFFDEAKPYLEQVAPQAESIWKIFKDKTVLLANSVINLPPLAERVMIKAERGELEFNIYWPELRSDIQTVRKTLRSLGYMMAACFTLSISAYFYVNNLIAQARYIWGLTLLFLLLFLKNAHARTRRNTRNRRR
ncbi:MAG: hypothetical protein LBR98_08155 [Syntrophomonadaceae bacterium]|jgi:predicted unusual protein kinase regulating ubiquinone biosynthesis (AarF/ABC1/UbiB family)|nr:hypothetical protein [Syntrophomonadaceae bacterium]